MLVLGMFLICEPFLALAQPYDRWLALTAEEYRERNEEPPWLMATFRLSYWLAGAFILMTISGSLVILDVF